MAYITGETGGEQLITAIPNLAPSLGNTVLGVLNTIGRGIDAAKEVIKVGMRKLSANELEAQGVADFAEASMVLLGPEAKLP